jgi:glyoxylase-like metal-dependent hydrolase (beta-lactamase superfamily II)
MQEFLPGVYRLNNKFVNLFLAQEADGFTVFDTGLARSGPALVLSAIAKLGGQPASLKRIFITHTDMDHTGGAAELKAKTGARLYASAVEAAAMRKGETSRAVRGGPALLTAPFKRLFPTPAAQEDEVVADEQVLPFLGGMRVILTPGHTPGHTSYFIQTRAGALELRNRPGLRKKRGLHRRGHHRLRAWRCDYKRHFPRVLNAPRDERLI